MPLSSLSLLGYRTVATETCGSYTKTTKFLVCVYYMDKCDVMICLHSAHTLAVARPCDFHTGLHHVVLWDTI